MTSPAGQSLLRHGLQTGGVLLVDGVRADERGLLGLDDFVAGLDALRPILRSDTVSLSLEVCLLRFSFFLNQWWKNYSYGLAGVFFSVLAFLSCA